MHLFLVTAVCEYRHNSFTAENEILWTTFLLYIVRVCRQSLWCIWFPKLLILVEKHKIKAKLRHSWQFKVTDFGTNQKPICDFLLVINTNLHPSPSYLAPFPSYCRLLVTFCVWERGTSNTLVWSEPLNTQLWYLAKETKNMSASYSVKNAFRYLEPFSRDSTEMDKPPLAIVCALTTLTRVAFYGG